MMLKIGDTVECEGNHDNATFLIHPRFPFQFQVVDMTAAGSLIDSYGFVHPAAQCSLVKPNG